MIVRTRMVHAAALLSSLVISASVSAGPHEEVSPASDGTQTKDMVTSAMKGVLPPEFIGSLPELDSSGAKLLSSYCVQCHNLPAPGLHTADEWPKVVARMVARINRYRSTNSDLHKVKEPTPAELGELLAYLQRFGFKAIDISRYPDLDSDTGKAFRKVCIQCHALPDPTIHNNEEWRHVVLRMRENMKQLDVADPGDEEIAKVIGFLQSHAQKVIK